MNYKSGYNISFLVLPDVETNKNNGQDYSTYGSFKDPVEGFKFYEKCAEVSLLLDGVEPTEANIADETHKLVERHSFRADGLDIGGRQSDECAMATMRAELLQRIEWGSNAPGINFYVTPETSRKLDEINAAKRAEISSPKHADGFNL
jgi:hypothetical protein